MVKRYISMALALLLLVGMIPNLASASTVNNWSAVVGLDETLNGVAYGDGKYVAVGDSGSILSTDDGTNWTSRTSGVTGNLFGVVYGNGLYVAVGDYGTILTSSDGEDWMSHTPLFRMIPCTL